MSADFEPQRCPACDLDLTEFWTKHSDTAWFCPGCQLPLSLVAGKYRLQRVLGEGGCGKVFLARHIHLHRQAERAIKVIRPELLRDESMVKRFFREIQVTSELSQQNEHIVRVYDDFGAAPKLGYFYVMEYLEGKTLSSLLKDPQRLPSLDWCFDIFFQLCKAMQDAHSNSIVHRDLKPDNLLLVERSGRSDFLKVLDFGIARIMSDTIQASPMTRGELGTPAYMSPEQCLNQTIDHRSDIYSMGIILYELCTGYTPFVVPGRESLSVMELLMRHVEARPHPARKISPERYISEAIDDVLFKSLAKKPQDRFQSVSEFQKALHEAQQKTTVTGAYPFSAYQYFAPTVIFLEEKQHQIPAPFSASQDFAPTGLSTSDIFAILRDFSEAPTLPDKVTKINKHMAHSAIKVTHTDDFSEAPALIDKVTKINKHMAHSAIKVTHTDDFSETPALFDNVTSVESRSVGAYIPQHAPALQKSGSWGILTFVSIGFVLLVVLGSWWWNPFSFSSPAPRSVDERESGQIGQSSLQDSTAKSFVQREATTPVVRRPIDSPLPLDRRPKSIVTSPHEGGVAGRQQKNVDKARILLVNPERRVAGRQSPNKRRTVPLKSSATKQTSHYPRQRSGWRCFRVGSLSSKDAMIIAESSAEKVLRVRRVSKGFCVPPHAARVLIRQDGFATCVFPIPPGTRTHIPLRLKRVMQGKIYPEPYCLSVR